MSKWTQLLWKISITICLLKQIPQIVSETSCDEDRYGYLCSLRDSCGKTHTESDTENRTIRNIFNGHDVNEGEFPSFVQLKAVDVSEVYCSGVIVSEYHVVTAYHCVRNSKNEQIDPSQVTVVAGTIKNIYVETAGTNFKVAKICRHPTMNDTTDIALLKLEDKLSFNNSVQPACWPMSGDKIPIAGPNSVCYQVGAGNYEPSPGARKVKPLIQKMKVQRFPYKGGFGKGFLILGRTDSSVCPGDSGGPTLCYDKELKHWTVIAIASRGNCGPSNLVYTIPLYSYVAKFTKDECPPG